jgi:hypothetical protein
MTRALVRLVALTCTWIGTPTMTPVVSAQAPSPTVIGSIGGAAELVKVHGSYAYVAAGPMLRVVSLADPAAPRVVGSFQFAQKVWALAVSGSTVYAANDWVGLAILDVTDPAAPRLRGTYKTLGQAWGVAILGDTAIVANQMSGIDVLDVSNLDKPVSAGQYFTEGYARDVAVAGSLAYVVDQPSGFSVLDVSTPGAPIELSTQQSAQSPLVLSVSEHSTGRRLASLAGGRGAQGYAIQVYDVSDPKAPVRASTVKTTGRTPRVAMLGALAYVADAADGLQILDLSEPTRPSRVASFPTIGPARDVAVTESLVLVAVGEVRPGADPREGGGGVLVMRRVP